jgi:ubiquinone/menaquinone biosynthesis C-methylase UbiE
VTVRLTQAERSRFDFGPLARDYDRWYATPAGRAHDRAQKRDAARLLGAPAGGRRLLDVGCGTGHWSAFFARRGYRVTGIDVAPAMIEAARAAVPNGSFRVADACELPFARASFDVVAAMATLEFLADPAAAAREMARCARPGGTLLVGTLNRLAPLNRRRVAAGKQPYASARLLAPKELKDLLAPWGTVRMLASAPSPGRRGRPPAPRRRLRGPFVIAQVRR